MSANLGAIGLPLAVLETPALCLDIEAYHRNVGRMIDYIVRKHGLAWRPHMKGQKAPELAREAIAAGAIGVTCATLYEAEIMVEAGVRGILIANQIAGKRKLERLARLERLAPVIAATDSLAHATELQAAASGIGVTIPVVVEVNVGMHRCGIAAGEPVVQLAQAISATPNLRFVGVMGWEGHTLGADNDARPEQVSVAIGKLTHSADLCRAAGIRVEIVSASGSGTFLLAAPLPGLTEVQAGGAVFSDLSYQRWGVDHEFALTILTRVVSRPSPTRIIVDGGFKTMSTQQGQPRPIGLEVKSLGLSAEHGTIELTEPNTTLQVGDPVTFIPGYTDSTLCLHDEICVIRKGILEAVWAIPGRTGRRA